MKSQDAKDILQLNNFPNHIGRWGYRYSFVIDGYYGKILHFLPYESITPSTTKLGKRMNYKNEHAICGLPDKRLSGFSDSTDYYALHHYPRCKKCVNKLELLSKGNK